MVSMNPQIYEAGCLRVIFFYIPVFTKVMERYETLIMKNGCVKIS